MTRPINSYADLLEEKARLKLLLAEQRAIVRQDIAEIKEEFAPVKKAMAVIGKFTTRGKDNWLLTTAADTAIDMVVKNMILARSGWITRIVLPFFMKNISSHVFSGNKDKILGRVFSLFGKKNHNKKEPVSQPVPDTLHDAQED